jgi:hypothetical protein
LRIVSGHFEGEPVEKERGCAPATALTRNSRSDQRSRVDGRVLGIIAEEE